MKKALSCILSFLPLVMIAGTFIVLFIAILVFGEGTMSTGEIILMIGLILFELLGVALTFFMMIWYMMGKEGVGGWMFLLHDTLYFKSHQQNIQVHELQIPLSYIRKLKCTKSGLRGIFRTGLDVELMDGRVEKYVVNDTKIWADSITEACKCVGNSIEIG